MSLRMEDLDIMRNNDQLTRERNKKRVFQGFKEGPLSFMPTYKFDVGESDVYDTSSKARVPSWTDRIQWRSDPACGHEISLTHYSSIAHIRYVGAHGISNEKLRPSKHWPC